MVDVSEGQPRNSPGASLSTSPTTNKEPPTQTTSRSLADAKAEVNASTGLGQTVPASDGADAAKSLAGMALGTFAWHQ